MIFDEWLERKLARGKEMDTWGLPLSGDWHDLSANTAPEKDPAPPSAEKEPGVTASTDPDREILLLEKDKYLIRIKHRVWVIDHETLIKLQKSRYGAWRI